MILDHIIFHYLPFLMRYPSVVGVIVLVERQRLLLCHFYRHRLKLAEERRAAERSAAYSQAAQHFRLITHAYLAELDTGAVDSS